MTTETTPESGQAPESGTGQAPTTPLLSHEDALAALSKVRQEAASYRTKLTAFERAQQEAEAAKLGELDAARKRAADMEAENTRLRQESRASVNRAKAELAAVKLGMVDPEVAVKLLDWDTLEYADDGTPIGIDGALKKLLTAKPYLAGGAGAAPTNPARANSGGGLTLDDVKKMSREQIMARWSDVQRAMQRNV